MRFRLRTVIITVAVLCAVLAWFARSLHLANEQLRTVNEVRRLGGTIGWRSRIPGVGLPSVDPWVGTSFFMKATQVDVDDTRFGDDQLKEISGYLRRLPDLEVVNIRRSSISDEGITFLTSLKPTVNVGIMHSPITDQGAKALQHFADSQELWLIATEITEAEATRLADALPNCAVMFDRDGIIDTSQLNAHYERRGAWKGTR